MLILHNAAKLGINFPITHNNGKNKFRITRTQVAKQFLYILK